MAVFEWVYTHYSPIKNTVALVSLWFAPEMPEQLFRNFGRCYQTAEQTSNWQSTAVI
jgi:hypothetical protein